MCVCMCVYIYIYICIYIYIYICIYSSPAIGGLRRGSARDFHSLVPDGGDDTVGNPRRARISRFELFELILLSKLDIVPCRAIRGSSISVNSTLPPSYCSGSRPHGPRRRPRQRRRQRLRWIDAFMRVIERKVKPLGASQSLSETFPCTGYEVFSLKGKALRGNRVARIGI